MITDLNEILLDIYPINMIGQAIQDVGQAIQDVGQKYKEHCEKYKEHCEKYKEHCDFKMLMKRCARGPHARWVFLDIYFQ